MQVGYIHASSCANQVVEVGGVTMSVGDEVVIRWESSWKLVGVVWLMRVPGVLRAPLCRVRWSCLSLMLSSMSLREGRWMRMRWSPLCAWRSGWRTAGERGRNGGADACHMPVGVLGASGVGSFMGLVLAWGRCSRALEVFDVAIVDHGLFRRAYVELVGSGGKDGVHRRWGFCRWWLVQ
eukprot:1187954-Prorocentrum_minimum.AAC.1